MHIFWPQNSSAFLLSKISKMKGIQRMKGTDVHQANKMRVKVQWCRYTSAMDYFYTTAAATRRTRRLALLLPSVLYAHSLSHFATRSAVLLSSFQKARGFSRRGSNVALKRRLHNKDFDQYQAHWLQYFANRSSSFFTQSEEPPTTGSCFQGILLSATAAQCCSLYRPNFRKAV